MSTRWLAVLVVGLVAWGARADDPKPGPDPPDKPLIDQVKAIKTEYQEREKKFYADLTTFRNDDKKIRELNDEFHSFQRQQIDKLKALVKDHATEADAF